MKSSVLGITAIILGMLLGGLITFIGFRIMPSFVTPAVIPVASPTPPYPPLDPPELAEDITLLRGRAWGPEQATGTPNTFGYGDIQTAWASLTSDENDEWLELTYKPVEGKAIQIYETYNPGAIVRVTVFTTTGQEHVVYTSEARSVTGDLSPRILEIPLNIAVPIDRVILMLDSRSVSGWNEIDAVGIRDGSGVLHWAESAGASSTYADPSSGTTPITSSTNERIRKLENQIRILQQSASPAPTPES